MGNLPRRKLVEHFLNNIAPTGVIPDVLQGELFQIRNIVPEEFRKGSVDEEAM